MFSFFSPVVGGASFADIGVALDEILSLSMDVSDEETKEPFPVQSHREIVISCCWLNIKVRSWCPFVCTVFEAVASYIFVSLFFAVCMSASGGYL